MIFIAEIDAHTGSGVITLGFSSGLGYNHPTSLAGFYEGRIIQPANYTCNIVDDGKTFGSPQVGYGELILENLDHGLDFMRSYGYRTQMCRIFIAEDEQCPYDDLTPFMTVTMEQPTFYLGQGKSQIGIRLRSRRELLKRPIQQDRHFLGNNEPPDGIEGLPELKSRPKPLAYGDQPNCPVPKVNDVKDIYMLSDNEANVGSMFDGGVPIWPDSLEAYGSLVELEYAQPDAGKYRWFSSSGGSYVRLGWPTIRDLTVDIREGTLEEDRSCARVWERIITGPGGLTTGEYNQASVDALHTAAPGPIGLWIDGNQNCDEVADLALSSCGANWYEDRMGVFHVFRISEPDISDSVYTFKSFGVGTVARANECDIISVERVAPNEEGRGVPPSRVRVGWGPNAQVQTKSDLNGDAINPDNDIVGGNERRSFLAESLRYTDWVSNYSIRDMYQGPDLTFETRYRDLEDAEDECDRQLALRAVLRDTLKVTVKFDLELVGIVALGATITMQMDWYEYNEGRPMIVIGEEYDALKNLIIFTLWG